MVIVLMRFNIRTFAAIVIATFFGLILLCIMASPTCDAVENCNNSSVAIYFMIWLVTVLLILIYALIKAFRDTNTVKCSSSVLVESL